MSQPVQPVDPAGVPAPVETDLLIIGAGPTGLYAAYYAGFRGLRVAVVDSLPEIGGQITAMYPEKMIYDVAGFPAVKGQDLVDALGAQARQFDPLYLLGHRAEELDHGTDSVTVTCDTGLTVTAKVVLISGGIGTFSPRPLPAADAFTGDGVMFFVPRLAELADLDVLIVGGGDSAFDWAMSLEPLAKSVTLVHRRDKFRAHEHTVQKVLASRVEVITSAEVAKLHGNGRVEGADIVAKLDGAVRTVPTQAVVAALGFVADLGPMSRWGLEQRKRHILVDSTMRTNFERVFAAGDIADYDGKVKLIATGFGEAATAVNNAMTVVDPSAKVFPGHSSDSA
ncbi:NAD(P)/FAD-dependent oxidoreductase [Yinghuangia sp. ASG 101]|uniref:NAD(P)/FAD-dependent oxidoreductase n=1 Tax=Yinghuangia sp. ASG 101 TaxID=2896848 RepID=UPI001E3DC397|nr:NAD(P)/FAD-dependent oxidoreductase [Yinghuangia sp. ASG 101]UGQ10678.1 NAD(P)/FAD-dependent oxidoreductase [Yinghuangia sp. ASG 101]